MAKLNSKNGKKIFVLNLTILLNEYRVWITEIETSSECSWKLLQFDDEKTYFVDYSQFPLSQKSFIDCTTEPA